VLITDYFCNSELFYKNHTDSDDPSLGLGLLHKIRLNFLEAFQQFSFLQGRVVSPTPNPHSGGPGLCIYIPQRQSGPVTPLGTHFSRLLRHAWVTVGHVGTHGVGTRVGVDMIKETINAYPTGNRTPVIQSLGNHFFTLLRPQNELMCHHLRMFCFLYRHHRCHFTKPGQKRFLLWASECMLLPFKKRKRPRDVERCSLKSGHS
jgi:hypothetical protein